MHNGLAQEVRSTITNAQIIGHWRSVLKCVYIKNVMAESESAYFTLYCTELEHEKNKKSILYFLYWFLHFVRHDLKATQYLRHCAQLFSELSALFFPLLNRNCHGFWLSSHFIRLTTGSWSDLPLLCLLPPSLTSVALRIVICSFPRQPTRTCVQRCLTDVEWKNMKPWLLSQNNHTFY